METISLVPTTVFNIGSVMINQGILSSFAVSMLIIALGLAFKFSAGIIPNKIQIIVETVYSLFEEQNKNELGKNKYTNVYTSFIFALFLFVFISNQFTVLPLVQSIIYNGNGIFLPPTAHLSQTVVLSLIIVILSHFVALWISPFKHINNLLNITSIVLIRSPKDIPYAFLSIFLMLLNVVGEFAKVISLACRLFGNIFAGEVMVAVIAGLSLYTSFFVPVPFIFLSLFSGLVQAFVFAILALSFINGNIKSVS